MSGAGNTKCDNVIMSRIGEEAIRVSGRVDACARSDHRDQYICTAFVRTSPQALSKAFYKKLQDTQQVVLKQGKEVLENLRQELHTYVLPKRIIAHVCLLAVGGPHLSPV